MQPPFSCIIVDDDELDRLATVSFVRRLPFLNIHGVYGSAETALKSIDQQSPEVIFLDIDMPGLSGLELRERILHIPVCIFITAYAEYAVESFEKAAFDFIVKPIKLDRFTKSMERVEHYLTIRDKAAILDDNIGGDAIYIKEGHEKVRIQLHEVRYLEALKDYTRIVTARKKYCVLSSLGNLLKEESFAAFVRIHRSFAVQKKYVSKIGSHSVTIDQIELPIGRSYKDVVLTS